MNAGAGKQVTISLDGINFTGQLIKQYADERDDIILVIRPAYYEMQGKRFPATVDDSVLRVSASTLVEVR